VFGKKKDPFVTIGNLAMTSSSELTIMARKKFPLEPCRSILKAANITKRR